MSNCLELPLFGRTCLGDLTVHVAGTTYDLAHPGVPAAALLIFAILVFVFRNPA